METEESSDQTCKLLGMCLRIVAKPQAAPTVPCLIFFSEIVACECLCLCVHKCVYMHSLSMHMRVEATADTG